MTKILPVWQTWTDVFKTLEQNATQYIFAAAVPFIIWIGQGIFLANQTLPMSAALVLMSLNVLLQVWLCISMMDITLTGKAANRFGVLYWHKRETRFTLYAVPLVVFMAVLSTFIIAMQLYALPSLSAGLVKTAYLTMLLSLLALLYVFSRCVLIYPAIVMNQPLGVQSIWKMTEGLGFRIMTIVFVIPVGANWLIGFMMRMAHFPVSLIELLDQIISLVFTVLAFNAAALVYQRLVSQSSSIKS